MRGATNLLEGEFKVWDPANPEPFTALAGPRLIRVEGEIAVIRNDDRSETRVYPGWLVFRADGSAEDGAVFLAPGLVGDQRHMYSLTG